MTNVIPPDSFRPLPDRPNLEFERKRAKKLVRAKQHEHEINGAEPMKLADAQLHIAREYGFSSWRKLVAYYNTWALHERTGPRLNFKQLDSYERAVAGILQEFERAKSTGATMQTGFVRSMHLASFIPRFYGLSTAEMLQSTLTEGEARLVVARQARFSTWNALCAHVNSRAPSESQEVRPITPYMRARDAIRANNRDELARLVESFPELREAPNFAMPFDIEGWNEILSAYRAHPAETREMFAWLASLGVDTQSHLNAALLGIDLPFKRKTIDIQDLLALGANAAWIPPNGLSVLEYGIARYNNGEAVDLIDQRVRPRKAFWVAAAMGDVRTMLQFINARGEVTEAARRDRPDFTALGCPILLSRPDATDVEIVGEAFMLAALNGRINTASALLDCGHPVDYRITSSTALFASVEFEELEVTRLLLSRGANPDYKVPLQNSPREIAEFKLERDPNNPVVRQLYDLFLQYTPKDAINAQPSQFLFAHRRGKHTEPPMTAATVGTHNESLEDAARLAYQMLRFETGASAFTFLPVGRKVNADLMISYLASTVSPLVLAPALRPGFVSLTMLDEFEPDRRKWAQHEFDNAKNALTHIAQRLRLDDTSNVLLAFNGESHVFSFAAVRKSFEMYAVFVGWGIETLKGDSRASAVLVLHGTNGKVSDSGARDGQTDTLH